jgi:hypothetical protein
MKNILLLVCALFVSVFASAQFATSGVTKGSTYVSITSPTSAPYIITNTTAKYWLVNAGQDFASMQDFAVQLDSVSGNHTNVAVALYGQKSELKADWTQIGSTVNWKGTTADTIILFTNATANRYRNFKVTYTGTGTGVTKITKQEFKLWLQ